MALRSRFKNVVLRSSQETVPRISQEEQTMRWNVFKTVYGRDQAQDEECTADQLTGIDTLQKTRCSTIT